MRRLFDNTRTVVARKGHPLANAKSLLELAGAEWATPSLGYRAEEDLAGVFRANGLPPPEVVLAVRSALSLIVALASTDLLAMLPSQWEGFPLTRGALDVIRIKEVIPAPDIVFITRPGIPLTPAAEYFSDVLLRHGQPDRAEAAA
jgi:DNA-binding transcriptional LysR family regulator